MTAKSDSKMPAVGGRSDSKIVSITRIEPVASNADPVSAPLLSNIQLLWSRLNDDHPAGTSSLVDLFAASLLLIPSVSDVGPETVDKHDRRLQQIRGTLSVCLARMIQLKWPKVPPPVLAKLPSSVSVYAVRDLAKINLIAAFSSPRHQTLLKDFLTFALRSYVPLARLACCKSSTLPTALLVEESQRYQISWRACQIREYMRKRRGELSDYLLFLLASEEVDKRITGAESKEELQTRTEFAISEWKKAMFAEAIRLICNQFGPSPSGQRECKEALQALCAQAKANNWPTCVNKKLDLNGIRAASFSSPAPPPLCEYAVSRLKDDKRIEEVLAEFTAARKATSVAKQLSRPIRGRVRRTKQKQPRVADNDDDDGKDDDETDDGESDANSSSSSNEAGVYSSDEEKVAATEGVPVGIADPTRGLQNATNQIANAVSAQLDKKTGSSAVTFKTKQPLGAAYALDQHDALFPEAEFDAEKEWRLASSLIFSDSQDAPTQTLAKAWLGVQVISSRIAAEVTANEHAGHDLVTLGRGGPFWPYPHVAKFKSVCKRMKREITESGAKRSGLFQPLGVWNARDGWKGLTTEEKDAVRRQLNRYLSLVNDYTVFPGGFNKRLIKEQGHDALNDALSFFNSRSYYGDHPLAYASYHVRMPSVSADAVEASSNRRRLLVSQCFAWIQDRTLAKVCDTHLTELALVAPQTERVQPEFKAALEAASRLQSVDIGCITATDEKKSGFARLAAADYTTHYVDVTDKKGIADALIHSGCVSTRDMLSQLTVVLALSLMAASRVKTAFYGFVQNLARLTFDEILADLQVSLHQRLHPGTRMKKTAGWLPVTEDARKSSHVLGITTRNDFCEEALDLMDPDSGSLSLAVRDIIDRLRSDSDSGDAKSDSVKRHTYAPAQAVKELRALGKGPFRTLRTQIVRLGLQLLDALKPLNATQTPAEVRLSFINMLAFYRRTMGVWCDLAKSFLSILDEQVALITVPAPKELHQSLTHPDVYKAHMALWAHQSFGTHYNTVNSMCSKLFYCHGKPRAREQSLAALTRVIFIGLSPWIDVTTHGPLQTSNTALTSLLQFAQRTLLPSLDSAVEKTLAL